MKNLIKELRARHNLKQEDLAKILEVSRQTISSIEKEKYNPSLELAFKVALHFECKIEDIFIYDSGGET